MPNREHNMSGLPRYRTEELLNNAEALFGVRPEVAAGALHGCNEAEYTVEQMKNMIEAFLNRRVS